MVRRSLLRSMASSPESSPILDEDNGPQTNSSASQESPSPSSPIVEEEATPATNSSTAAQESPPPPTEESPPPRTAPPPESSPPPPPPNAPPPSTPTPSPPPPSSPPPPIASTPPPKESPKSSPPPPETPGPPPATSQPPPPSASSPPPTPSAVPSPPSPIVSSPTPPPPPGPPVPSLTPPSTTLSPPLAPPRPTSSPNTTSGSSIGPGLGGPTTHPPSSSASGVRYLIAGIVVGGVLVLLFITACLICAKRSKKKKKPVHYINTGIVPPTGGAPYYPTQWNGPQTAEQMIVLPPPPGLVGPPPGANQYSGDFYYSSGHSGPPLSPTNMGGIGAKSQFTYEELAVATDGFSQANVLGQGGFGYVHRGVLQPDKRQVAVKSLKAGSGQGEREFQAEVEIISRVHHRHLVSLVGYCIAGEKRMLVYEYVPNKTLEFHLHGKGQPVMDWATRLRIAVGSAKGLAYLHEDCHPRIIHRDIKAANILLDDNFEAMVADFGLAKLTSDNYTHISTRVMGTFGYLAPEYASSGKLTEKSDVFSFGVMLLELITGRRPVDLTNKTEDSLVDWARPLLSKAMEDGNYNELVDPRLEGNYVPQEMARMVTCSAASIRHSARRRPKMSQIVRALDGDSSLHDMNEGVKPGQSMVYHNNPNGNTEAYDTRAYDADMLRFKKMVMMSSSQEFDSSEYGATTSDDYGLNHPSSSSGDSGEVMDRNNNNRKAS